MGKIINQNEISKHNIEKFTFNVIESNDEIKENIFHLKEIDERVEEKKKVEKEIQKEAAISHERDEEAEIKKKNIELLTQIESLTNKVVSLEMQLEEQKNEYEIKLKEIEQRAFQKGIEEAKNNYENELEELKIQYISSITNLQEIGIEIDKILKKLEEELIETSIIIAKKVILKELEENSYKVAKSIALYLLEDIREDLEIKLLVNPIDYQILKDEKMGDNIKLIADSNIEKGGVVILSPKKNIDGTIKTRLKRTLQLIKDS